MKFVSISAPILIVALSVSAGTPNKDMANNSPKLERMDYGPFLSNTIVCDYPVPKSETIKGISIRLGDKKQAAMCFDTDTLKYSVAWTGGFVHMNLPKDGIAGVPTIKGTPVFGTKGTSIGWAKDGSFKDPRKAAVEGPPRGPLPADWAKWKGLYLDGERVVLSYRVGDCEVLESPSYFNSGDVDFFVRTMRFGKSSVPLTTLLLEWGTIVPGEVINPRYGHFVLKEQIVKVNVSKAPAQIKYESGRVLLELPALKEPLDLEVQITSLHVPAKASDRNEKTPVDFDSITKKGGAPRWKVLEAKGEVSHDAKSAYVVDSIGIPIENPWDAYMRFAGFDFFKDGRCAVCTISGDVWIVSGIDDKLEKQKWQRFATGLFVPMGLKIVNEQIYVACRDQLTRLHDLNGDGEADFYENFNNDCQMGIHYQEYAMDLETDAQGNFYFVRGAFLDAADSIHEGTMMRVSPDGSKSEIFATGFRCGNGLAIGPNGEITTSDNQGNWMPATPINLIKKGGFYGFQLPNYPEYRKSPRQNPVCWIPYHEDTSGAGQVWAGKNWGPLSGRLLHTSYGKSRLYLVLMEKYQDMVQGGVIRFPLEFASGLMRGRVNPVDGQVYVCGLHGWQTNGVKDAALQRVRYTGKPFNSCVNVETLGTGLRLTFASELDASSAQDTQNWSAERYNIKYSSAYGSPEYSVDKPEEKGRDEVEIKSAKLDASGKVVTLEFGSMKLCHCLMVKYKLKSKDGAALSQEVDYTINFIPGGAVSPGLPQTAPEKKPAKK